MLLFKLPLSKVLLFSLSIFLFFDKVNAQWPATVKLTPLAMNGLLNENMGQCIAANGSTIHVVWSDKRTTGTAIYYSHSTDTGHTWISPVILTDTNSIANFPAIAVSGSHVHVVWRDSSLGRYASFYKSSSDGGSTWNTSFCLDSNTLFWPGVAAHDSLVVVSMNGGTFGATIVYFRRSLNYGATWDTIRTISTRTGTGRSEDPAINTDGKNVFLSWNDNRSGKMDIYYRRSTDKGVNWDSEIPVATHGASGYCYTTMTSVNDSNVDVVYADSRTGNFEVYIKQSHNYGASFDTAIHKLTNASPSGAYPYLVRTGSHLHLCFLSFASSSTSGPYYMYSSDGGSTWTTPLQLGAGGQPFIALTCPVLHAIWPDSGKIRYSQNPVGDTTCISDTSSHGGGSTSVHNIYTTAQGVIIYPNPATNMLNFKFTQDGEHVLELYGITGNLIYRIDCSATNYSFNCGQLPAGMYFIRLAANGQVLKFIKE